MKRLLALLLIPLFATPFACVSHPSANPTQVTVLSTSEEPAMSITDTPVFHTEEEWKKILTPEQFAVLRKKATEAPFTGQYDDFTQPGTYSCAACGQLLFTSNTKFNAGCGWPAFYAAAAGDKVKLVKDYSHGAIRTEVLCANCGSHLGHLFTGETHEIDGTEKTVDRYCINSVALKFTPAEKK